MTQRYGLGRGLSSLIPQKSSDQKSFHSQKPLRQSSYETTDDDVYTTKTPNTQKPLLKEREEEISTVTPVQEGSAFEVEIGMIIANSHQPRVAFDEEKLRELADSIREHGVIQPLIVNKKDKENSFELIAGERRLRAAKMAGLSKVPIVIRETPVQEKFEIAILENVQRHDLSPMEEARAYRRLMDEFHLSQEDVAFRMGKSRSSIANIVRFLELPLEIQKALEEGHITQGHAKVILALDNSEKQRALYDLILREGLTVRQTEDRLRIVSSTMRVRTRSLQQDPELKESEEELHQALGTKVRVSKMGNQGAKVSIDFYSKEDLDNFLEKIR